MKWVELSVETPPEFVEPLSEVFFRYGHGGVAVEEIGGHNPDEGEPPVKADRVTVKTYVPLDSGAEERRNRIDLGVRLVSYLCPIISFRERILEEEEWEQAWKQHFQVLHAGKRLVVVPTWRHYRPRRQEVVIKLDPGMAFGTGHHPTTQMCLELVEELVSPGMDVIDVGCGSGILAIVAAKLGAKSVLGLEIDPVATAAAEANVRRNRVAQRATIAQGTLPRPQVSSNSYDVAIANISSKVVSELAEELVSAVRSGGTLIVSGLLREGRVKVSRRLTAAGAVVHRSVTEGDWASLVATIE